MFFKKKPIITTKRPSNRGFIDPTNLDKPVEFDTSIYDQILDEHVAKRDEAAATEQRRRQKLLMANSKVERPSEFAVALIGKLPKDLSLVHLFADYPRILNKIAVAWGDHRAFFSLLDDLMIDKRGGREGFPFSVAQELSRLTDHYEQFVGKRPGGDFDVIQNARKPKF